MTIWALKGPSSDDYDQEEYSEVVKYLSDSIRKGTSRFGWGYVDTADLKRLQDLSWQEMTSDEQNCWRKANFLLEVKKGDWVVHINLPYWGACFAGQVIEEYSFQRLNQDGVGDYGHTLKIDPKSIVEFERNDETVLPIIGSRLKLQGGHWRIQHEEEFLQTIQNIKIGSSRKNNNESIGVFYLKQDLTPQLKEITKKIQKAHPSGKLESFMAEVLRKVPNVISVTEHGKHKGWGTDSGADLIVNYKSGLSFSNLEKQEKLVVQVKSFTGDHWETNAVEQIEEALNEFEAATGLIITTAESTKNLEEAIEALSKKLEKPIGLIAGQAVAKFVLKYGGELIL